jgi:P4 family phage/plasmid primase-like protien
MNALAKKIPSDEDGIKDNQKEDHMTSDQNHYIADGPKTEPPVANIHPFGIDPLVMSREFLVNDFAKSGLVLSDVPPKFKIEPLPLGNYGHPAYRIHYSNKFYKDRIDWPKGDPRRDTKKYINMKGGHPEPVYFGSPVKGLPEADVEGFKKGLKFFKDTGLYTTVFDSCYGYRDPGSASNELHPKIIRNASITSERLVLFDGDYKTNEDVGRALTSYNEGLRELGISAVFVDLGSGSDGKRLGYDDWSMLHQDILAPLSQQGVWNYLLQKMPKAKIEDLPIARDIRLASLENFNSRNTDYSELGAATSCLQLVGRENVKYLYDTKEWAIWNGTTWRRYSNQPYQELPNRVALLYNRRLEALQTKIIQLTAAGKTEHAARLAKHSKVVTKWAGRSASNNLRDAILRDLANRAELRAAADEFDADRWLLGVANGVVDLRTGELRDVKQEDMLLRRCPVPFSPVEPTGIHVERIKQFLIEILGDTYQEKTPPFYWTPKPNEIRYSYFSRRLGAAMFGANTLTTLENWTGEGANGKSVLMKLIEHTLGLTDKDGYWVTVPAAVIMSAFRQRDAESSTPFRASLRGARIVAMPESKDTDHFDEAVVKSLTGGDRMRARDNYKGDSGGFDITFTPILLTNKMPKVPNGDTAFWDRWHGFEFKNRWRRPNVIDPTLRDADTWFEDTAPGLPEVQQWMLWWLIQNAVKFHAEGLPAAPDDVHKLKIEYQEREDALQHWFDDSGFVFDPDGWTLVSIVYNQFKNWMTDGGNKPPSSSTFVTRLQDRFPKMGVEPTRLRVPTGLSSGKLSELRGELSQQRVLKGIRKA